VSLFLGQELVDVMASSSREPNASDSSSISLQSNALMKKGGFNLAQWQMDRSFQKVLKKPNNLFAKQHHEAKFLFWQDLLTSYREIHALELSEDNYFVTAGMYHKANIYELTVVQLWHIDQALSSQKDGVGPMMQYPWH